MTFQLDSDEATRELYPFDFRLNMTYSTDGTSLEQRFAVTNTGDVDLPFTLGGHPAFNVPMPGAAGETFDDYALVFAKAWSPSVPVIDEKGIHDFGRMTQLMEDSRELALSHRAHRPPRTLVFHDVPQSRVAPRRQEGATTAWSWNSPALTTLASGRPAPRRRSRPLSPGTAAPPPTTSRAASRTSAQPSPWRLARGRSSPSR